jgi:ribA/ribD-fused uncharacterized protein
MIVEFDKEYMFLSNFYNASCTFEGHVYPTVEHAFQAAKTLDPEMRKMIAAAPTPGKAKRMGREVKLRDDWEQVKTDVMKECLISKFKFPPLRAELLATGNEELMEGNWWHDNTWGNCLCSKCQDTPGRNMLGMLLMEVRSEIRYEEAKKICGS